MRIFKRGMSKAEIREAMQRAMVGDVVQAIQESELTEYMLGEVMGQNYLDGLRDLLLYIAGEKVDARDHMLTTALRLPQFVGYSGESTEETGNVSEDIPLELPPSTRPDRAPTNETVRLPRADDGNAKLLREQQKTNDLLADILKELKKK